MSTNIKKFTLSAIFVAIAYVLSFVKLLHLPFGGSITLFSMLFISFPSYFFGLKYGFMASISYSLLQLIVDPYIVHPIQLILDYIIAFSSFGIVGIFGREDKDFVLGFIIACLIRFIASTISGYVFFKEYTPEGWNPIVYTVVYNGSYIFTECVLSLIVISVKPVKRILHKFRNQYNDYL